MTEPEPSDADPMPVPPPQPDFDLCCGNGCDPCIFDLHDLAMDAYRESLRAIPTRSRPGPRLRENPRRAHQLVLC